MDHPVNFAAQFARLVRLVEERADVVAQKAALRGCLAASKLGGVSLVVEGDALLAGGIAVRRDEDSDLLVARIASRGIASIVVAEGAAPGDMLTAARWLARLAGADPDNETMLLGLRTVHVVPRLELDVDSAPDVPPPAAEPNGEAEITPARRRSGLTLPTESRPTARRKSGNVGATDGPAPRRKTGSVPVGSERVASGRSGSFPSFEGGRRKSGTVTAIDFDPLPRTRATELLEMLDRAAARRTSTHRSTISSSRRTGLADAIRPAAVRRSAVRASGPAAGRDPSAHLRGCLQRLLTPSFLRMLRRAAARSRPRAAPFIRFAACGRGRRCRRDRGGNARADAGRSAALLRAPPQASGGDPVLSECGPHRSGTSPETRPICSASCTPRKPTVLARRSSTPTSACDAPRRIPAKWEPTACSPCAPR